MKLIYHALLLVIIFPITNSYCQDSIKKTLIYQLANGSFANVSDVSDSSGQLKFSAIYFGAFGPEGFNNIGVFHVEMDKNFFISGAFGKSGGIIDGNIFFKKKYKEYTVTQSIDRESSKYQTILYQISLPGTKVIASGIHFGASHINHQKSRINPANLTSSGLILGWSSMILKHAKWKVEREDVKRTFYYRGSMFNRFNFDVVYYYRTKIIQGSSSPKVSARPIGLRLYWDGCATSWSGTRASLSIHYMAGIGVNSNENNDIPLIGGLGIGISF